MKEFILKEKMSFMIYPLSSMTAKSLKENSKQKVQNFEEDFKREIDISQIQELKRTLEQLHDIEEQATNLIAKFENKEKRNGLSS